MKEPIYASSISTRYDLINAVLDNFDGVSTVKWLKNQGFDIETITDTDIERIIFEINSKKATR